MDHDVRRSTEQPRGMTAEGIDEVLAALADPTRRRVLDLLAARGEATATALAAELPVSRQAIVKHLALLQQAGLVSGSRVGREVRYAPRSQPLDATARWMAGLAAEWDARLAAIKRIAESGADPARPAATGRPAADSGAVDPVAGRSYRG